MIPHIATVAHHPPSSYGDCLRASIASLFDVEDAETVPHFMMSGDQEIADALLREWLAARGLRPFMSAIGGHVTWDEIAIMMGNANPDVEYLLFCNCGDGDHVVVCRGARMIHNTAMVRSQPKSPNSSGYWVIMVFVPMVLRP